MTRSTREMYQALRQRRDTLALRLRDRPWRADDTERNELAAIIWALKSIDECYCGGPRRGGPSRERFKPVPELSEIMETVVRNIALRKQRLARHPVLKAETNA